MRSVGVNVLHRTVSAARQPFSYFSIKHSPFIGNEDDSKGHSTRCCPPEVAHRLKSSLKNGSFLIVLILS